MSEKSRKVVEVFEEDGVEITRYDDGTQDWVIRDFPDELCEKIVKMAEKEGVSQDEMFIRMLRKAVS
jgi:hypothetical protein